MYVSMRSEYGLLWMFLTAIWKPSIPRALGDVVSVAAKIFIDDVIGAKKARSWEMNWGSLLVIRFQSSVSAERSMISTAVQMVGVCSEKWFGSKEPFGFGGLVC